jgi:hypothetical protein
VFKRAWLLLLFLFALPVAAQDRSAVWEQWDVVIDQVDTENNQFRVTELYRIRFDGTFRGGDAFIPDENLESIEVTGVWQDDRRMEEVSCFSDNPDLDPGTYCVYNQYNGELILYDFFQRVTDSTETVRIEYTIDGALRVYEDGDQLWWTAVATDRPGDVEASTITLELPEGFAPREGVDPVVTYGAAGDVRVNGTTVVAEATEPIPVGMSFELRAQYPHDPAARTPSWQRSFDRAREAEEARLDALERERQARLEFEQNTLPLINVGTIAFALLLGLGGVLVTVVAFFTKGRKPPIGPVPEYLTEPPDVIPAIAGTIIDGETHVRDLLSTLLDLARREYLVMEELEKGFSGKFVFKRTPKADADLTQFEREFLEAIFTFSDRDSRTLDSLRNSFYSHIPSLELELKNLMIAQGLIEPGWQGLRNQWRQWGQILLILGLGLWIAPDFIRGFRMFTLEEYIVNILRACAFVSAMNGGALLLFSYFVSNLALTRKGAEAAAKSNAFFTYLQNLDKFGDAEKTAARFDEFLPYTVAFGLDQTWINRFRELPNQPVPQWYYPVYQGGVFADGYRPGQRHPFSRANRRPDGTFDLSGLFGGGSSSSPGGAAASSGGAAAPASSLDDLSRGLSTGLNDISTGLSGMLNGAASAFVSQPLPPPSYSSGSSFLDGIFESDDSDSGSSWSSSSRSRSSGYRSSRPSGGWSSGGRSFSGGGRRSGGSSGGGRRGFR